MHRTFLLAAAMTHRSAGLALGIGDYFSACRSLLPSLLQFMRQNPESGLLVSLFSTALAHAEKLIELLPNPRFRATVLFMSLFLPTMGFALGRQQAYLVKTGAADQFVDVERSRLLLTAEGKNQVAYLGLLGNLYVLREGKTGHIVFVKQRDDSPLFLVPRQ